MARNFTGSTVNARAAILPAGFWRKGTRITGRYIRTYATVVDGDTLEIHQFNALGDVTAPLDDKGRFDPNGKPTKLEKFAVGNLSGIDMAIQDLKTQGFDFFRTSDYVTFECTDVQPSMKSGFSDMPLFSVSISDRPPQAQQAQAS
jgi:hypothetical protein